ncbi:MAG: glycosyltransferase family 9 protein [Verrucomicrobia bacterium]|nr:glycosyltransferase family 9 protein [Verrucomicrobiota bacterium]
MQIVVLRGGALGDIVLTLPILQALRDFYPDCFVTLVAPYPQAILARYHTDRVLDLNSARLLGLFKPGASLQDEARECLRADLILSYLSDPDRMIEKKLTSSDTTKFFQAPFKLDLERRPAVEQLAQPLAILGITSIDPVPRLTVSPPIRSMNRLAIHPGSGSRNKNWPLAHWSELLRELMPSFDEILLISGEADTEISEAVRTLIPATKVRLCANRSLWDLVSELSQATLFIGHDSGVTHVAAATGVPTVALFGPTDPTIWAPNGDHVIVVTSPDRTMVGLSVETVLAKLPHGNKKS